MGEMRNTYRILVREPDWKRELGRPRCRCKDNIKMDLKKYGVRMRTIYLAQDRVQWCEHSNEPSGSIKDKIF
jgi:hypothetical protein